MEERTKNESEKERGEEGLDSSKKVMCDGGKNCLYFRGNPGRRKKTVRKNDEEVGMKRGFKWGALWYRQGGVIGEQKKTS